VTLAGEPGYPASSMSATGPKPVVSPQSTATPRSYRPLLLSALVCPGLGQIAQGEPLKGWLLVVASLLAAAGVAAKVLADALRLLPRLVADPSLEEMARFWVDLREASGLVMVGGTALLTGLWLYSVLDAYRSSTIRPGDPIR
jgi:hypothetical protein